MPTIWDLSQSGPLYNRLRIWLVWWQRPFMGFFLIHRQYLDASGPQPCTCFHEKGRRPRELCATAMALRVSFCSQIKHEMGCAYASPLCTRSKMPPDVFYKRITDKMSIVHGLRKIPLSYVCWLRGQCVQTVDLISWPRRDSADLSKDPHMHALCSSFSLFLIKAVCCCAHL